MCGFAGFAASAPAAGSLPERIASLHAMGAQLARRGPDDEQLLVDDYLGLVFRRLAIVDCEGGRQPIANEDGTLSVAVNGEIFNHEELRRALAADHVFRTRSDAEVVLHLFEDRGPDALGALIGLFAIAIWDSTRRRLFLARDRFGIKPLYYAPVGPDLLFGSEIKALLAHPACSRRFRWRDCSPEPGRLPTFVSGVDSLPGGHYLTWEPGRMTATRRYWNLDEAMAAPDEGLTADDYVERYADLFEESVRLRLMGEVPVGAFVSGGLDSAAMAAAAARQGQALPCFTIVERSSWQCGDAQAAADVASLVGAPFYPVLYDHRTLGDELRLGLEDLEYFVWLMELPAFSLEFLFKHELHRFAKTVIPDLKVILLGQGADEFAGGYSNSAARPHAGWDDYVTRSLTPAWKAERRHALGIAELFAPVVSRDVYEPLPAAPFHHEMRERLYTLQTFNLWHEDRTSAGQGIEARVPYLDHRLVELLAGIPPRLHEELFWDKQIVRRAARRWLPESLVARRKVPFVFAGDRSSTVDFLHRLVAAIFPEFREEYLQGPYRLFDEAMLVQFMRIADAQPGRREQAVRFLVTCMGISILERMCRKGPADFSATWRPPSPLRRCEPADAPWAAEPA